MRQSGSERRKHLDGASTRQTDSLAALALTLFLVVVGLYLVDILRAQAAFQDCVISGKRSCDTLN